MTKGTIKVEEICAIIKECGISGVRELSFNGLKLSFGDRNPEPMAQTMVPHYAQPIPPEVVATANAQTKAANAEEELLYKQEELDQMLIEDPVGYFDALKRGDFVNEERA